MSAYIPPHRRVPASPHSATRSLLRLGLLTPPLPHTRSLHLDTVHDCKTSTPIDSPYSSTLTLGPAIDLVITPRDRSVSLPTSRSPAQGLETKQRRIHSDNFYKVTRDILDDHITVDDDHLDQLDQLDQTIQFDQVVYEAESSSFLPACPYILPSPSIEYTRVPYHYSYSLPSSPSRSALSTPSAEVTTPYHPAFSRLIEPLSGPATPLFISPNLSPEHIASDPRLRDAIHLVPSDTDLDTIITRTFHFEFKQLTLQPRPDRARSELSIWARPFQPRSRRLCISINHEIEVRRRIPASTQGHVDFNFPADQNETVTYSPRRRPHRSFISHRRVSAQSHQALLRSLFAPTEPELPPSQPDPQALEPIHISPVPLHAVDAPVFVAAPRLTAIPIPFQDEDQSMYQWESVNSEYQTASQIQESTMSPSSNTTGTSTPEVATASTETQGQTSTSTVASASAPEQGQGQGQGQGAPTGSGSNSRPTTATDPRDSTTHHSTSDRPTSSQNYQPTLTYAQDPARTRRGGQPQGTMFMRSSPPIAIPIPHLHTRHGWSPIQAYIREGLNARLDVFVRDVQIREPNSDLDFEFEQIHFAAVDPTYSAAQRHANALTQANDVASSEGGLVVVVRIWTELDGETEGLIRRETVNLVQQFRRG